MHNHKLYSSNSIFTQSYKKLLYTIILVSVIFTAKITGAFITKSLALFSDSWHLATDLISILISWWGVRIARKHASRKYSFGYSRFSVLTALINNISLIFISVFIFYKAVLRYLSPVTVKPEGMVIFSVIGLIVNLMIILILRNNSGNANVKSVFLHFMGDALSDAGVFIGGIIIYITGWYGIDTLLSAFLACLILRNALKMAYECICILLEAVPKGLSLDKLKNSIKEMHGIIDVKDIHVWSLSMETLTMTAHISIEEKSMNSYESILHDMQHMLKDKYNIEHSTFQIEHSPCSSCYHSKPEHREKCSMCIDCTGQRL